MNRLRFFLPAFVFALFLPLRVLFASSPSEVAEIATPLPNGFTHIVKVWPTEVYLGDPVYFCEYCENRSDESLRQCDDYLFSPAPLSFDLTWCWSAWELRSPNLANSSAVSPYRFLPELDGPGAFTDYCVFPRDYQPNDRGDFHCGTLELPPLEDLRSEFWKPFAAAPESGVECELRAVRLRNVDGASFKIRVKPRPANEARTLERWFDATPPELFPEAKGSVKYPRNLGPLKSSGKSDVRVGGVPFIPFVSKRYDPWFFVRLGNRKPSDPNNPTGVSGWRRLEAEFAPSTLRDEITLTRLQLEYYDAPEGEASDAALKVLADWLRARPEPQRAALTESLRSKGGKFKETPLETKNRKLLQALNFDAAP
ncbi:MAG: hypothetical protein IKU86_12735 [Thermoguttaceae bacterium]|nr:hypothetical protein [Thermoguttaceae bacterium]